MFHPLYVDRVLDPGFTNWKRHFADASLRVHRAHLTMLEEQKLLPQGVAARLHGAIDTLASSFVPPAKIPDGIEDLYFLFERELGALVGVETAGYLHLARSRNDMDTTIFRLVLKERLLAFLGRVLNLATVLRRGSDRTELFLLATHGQPANVSTLGHYLSAFLAELLEDVEDLFAGLETVDRSTLGACAITTTGFNLNRQRVAELLGLGGLVANSYQAIATGHWLTRPATAARQLALDLTRLVADMGPKASAEVGILRFPDALVQSSSIMPQKRNPVILEHVRIQAGLAAGTLGSVADLFRNLAFQDVNEVADAPVTVLFEALETLTSAVDLLTVTIEALEVDENKVRSIARDLGVTTTELADSLVREKGISFREAHGVVHAFVKAGNDKAALRSGFAALGHGPLDRSDAWIDDTLSAERFVAVRKVYGGPAPEGMAPVLELLDGQLGQFRRRLERGGGR